MTGPSSPLPGAPAHRPSALLVLLLLVVLAHGAGLAGSFQYDDFRMIVGNPAVHSLEAWGRTLPGSIRPLLNLSYALTWQVAPVPAAFLLGNLLVHGLNAWLVLRLAERLLGRGPGSFLAAALFALHPVQTEAVAYACGRSVSLAATGCLLSLEALSWPRAGRLASPAFFLAALLVRETALVVPAAILLLERLQGLDWGAALRRIRPHGLLALAAAAVPWFQPGYHRFFSESLALRPLAVNLGTQLEGLGYLLSRLLLPWHLNFDPDLPPPLAVEPWRLATWALLAGSAALLLHRLRPGRTWAFGALWLFLWLLPTQSLFPRRDVASERHLYLALAGPALALGAGLDRILRGGRPTRIAALAGSSVLLLGLGALTFFRTRTYATEVSLWEDTCRKSPLKARPHNNLGYAYEQAGRTREAQLEYRRALALDPAYDLARRNLARIANTREVGRAE